MASKPPTEDPAVTSLSLQPGNRVDAYAVTQTLATGGSAVVYKAHDALLDRYVAIKQIILSGTEDENEQLRQAVRREAEVHKKLSTQNSKHLVQFIDALEDPRGIMLISEYYPSASLEQMLQSTAEPLEQRQALGIMAATAMGLKTVHEGGVIHRDLKPSNILLGHDGGLKVCDLGLAALIEHQDLLSVGSVRYMAPELMKGESADGRADLYALGMIGYEMFAGRGNFDTAFRTVLRDQRNQAMRWMKWHTNPRAAAAPLSQYSPELPEHLVNLVARLMDKDPARRIARADDVVEAIRRHFTGQAPVDQPPPPIAEVTASTPGDTAPLPRPSRLPWILGGLVAFWLIVAAVLLVINDQQKAQALERRQLAAVTAIEQGNAHYNEGRYALALEQYEQVLGRWEAQSQYAVVAQAALWKARGHMAMGEGRYGEAAQHWSRYRGSGAGDPASVVTLIEDARLAESFQLMQASLRDDIAAQRYSEGRREIARWRELGLTPDQEGRLDALLAELNQREVETMTADRIVEARDLAADDELAGAIAILEGVDTLPEAGQSLLASLKEQAARADLMAQGEAAQRRDDLAAAIAAYEQAQQLEADDALAGKITRLRSRKLTFEGTALVDAGRFEQANVKFTEAIELDPDNGEARRQRERIATASARAARLAEAQAAVEADDFDKAVEALELALTLGPDATVQARLSEARLAQSLAGMAQAVARGELEQAATLLERAQTSHPDDARVTEAQTTLETHQRYAELRDAGDEARRRGDFGEAKERYRAAREVLDTPEINTRLNRTTYEQSVTLARSYLAQREYAAARAMLLQAQRIDPSEEVQALLQRVEEASPETGPEDDAGGDAASASPGRWVAVAESSTPRLWASPALRLQSRDHWSRQFGPSVPSESRGFADSAPATRRQTCFGCRTWLALRPCVAPPQSSHDGPPGRAA